MIGLAQATGNQLLVQTIVTTGLTAATEAMKQVLGSFDLKNINRILMNEEEIRAIIQTPQQPPGAPPQSPGIDAGQGNNLPVLPPGTAPV